MGMVSALAVFSGREALMINKVTFGKTVGIMSLLVTFGWLFQISTVGAALWRPRSISVH